MGDYPISHLRPFPLMRKDYYGWHRQCHITSRGRGRARKATQKAQFVRAILSRHHLQRLANCFVQAGAGDAQARSGFVDEGQTRLLWQSVSGFLQGGVLVERHAQLLSGRSHWPCALRRHCSMQMMLDERNQRYSPGFHGAVVNCARSSSGKVHSRRDQFVFVFDAIFTLHIYIDQRDKKEE
jgi:hypothetical protein